MIPVKKIYKEMRSCCPSTLDDQYSCLRPKSLRPLTTWTWLFCFMCCFPPPPSKLLLWRVPSQKFLPGKGIFFFFLKRAIMLLSPEQKGIVLPEGPLTIASSFILKLGSWSMQASCQNHDASSTLSLLQWPCESWDHRSHYNRAGRVNAEKAIWCSL